jgi:hypothetical protein
MTDPRPLTREELERLHSYHYRYVDTHEGKEWCENCDVEWPCHDARLLATIRQLDEVIRRLVAIIEEIRDDEFKATYEQEVELHAALAAAKEKP